VSECQLQAMGVSSDVLHIYKMLSLVGVKG
jgi:hypothetical protein